MTPFYSFKVNLILLKANKSKNIFTLTHIEDCLENVHI